MSCSEGQHCPRACDVCTVHRVKRCRIMAGELRIQGLSISPERQSV